uniref:Uncharacterized protein n=1 Tax=Anguilla anguilla TaxID=7936 RepID=A0A0E9U9I8_ANGAN
MILIIVGQDALQMIEMFHFLGTI